MDVGLGCAVGVGVGVGVGVLLWFPELEPTLLLTLSLYLFWIEFLSVDTNRCCIPQIVCQRRNEARCNVRWNDGGAQIELDQGCVLGGGGPG